MINSRFILLYDCLFGKMVCWRRFYLDRWLLFQFWCWSLESWWGKWISFDFSEIKVIITVLDKFLSYISEFVSLLKESTNQNFQNFNETLLSRLLTCIKTRVCLKIVCSGIKIILFPLSIICILLQNKQNVFGVSSRRRILFSSSKKLFQELNQAKLTTGFCVPMPLKQPSSKTFMPILPKQIWAK